MKRRGRIVPAILTYSVPQRSPASISGDAPAATVVGNRTSLPLPRPRFSAWKGREAPGACAASILAGGIMGPVAFALATADGLPVAVTPDARAACTVFTALCWHGGRQCSMIRGRKDRAMGRHCFSRVFVARLA